LSLVISMPLNILQWVFILLYVIYSAICIRNTKNLQVTYKKYEYLYELTTFTSEDVREELGITSDRWYELEPILVTRGHIRKCFSSRRGYYYRI